MVPWTNEILLLIACAFSLAGFVKGVVGFGLPTVALAVMAIATGAVEAMVLMLAPSLVTNAWQALAG
ncbi:MAG: sulfite exporter TauE/SafE family protein, partial [Rhodospirillaceae bacterium]|nr:sulfite exporter TauE/SafE family protein [Rhodospirillaceae bacterium]